MYPFNVRVYGILINNDNQVLISDEQEYGFRFTKFPGGGLEPGEGLIDGLKREFVEECNLNIEVISHFYTTDFYVKSAFNDSQISSVYYRVKNIDPINLNMNTVLVDFYVKSAFNDSQIISVYYLVKNIDPINLNMKTVVFDFDNEGDVLQVFRWV